MPSELITGLIMNLLQKKIFNIDQLSKISGLKPSDIKKCEKAGIVQNEEGCYFFASLVALQELKKMLDSGKSLNRVLKDFQKLRELVSDTDIFEAVKKLQVNKGQIILKDNMQRSFDARGQYLLTFATKTAIVSYLDEERNSRREQYWFERARKAEEQGEWKNAFDFYENALNSEATAEIHFSYGNLLYQVNEKARAADQFLKAVLIDENYFEAWNNLGSILGELECVREAIKAMEKALLIFADYFDAHYNLANIYLLVRKDFAALKHYRACLRIDPVNQMTEEIQSSIEKIETSSLSR